MRDAVWVLVALGAGVAGGLVPLLLRDDAAPLRAGGDVRRTDNTALQSRLDSLEGKIDRLALAVARASGPARETAATFETPPDAATATSMDDPAQPPEGGDPARKARIRATPVAVAKLIAGLKGARYDQAAQQGLYGWLLKNRESLGDVIAGVEAAIRQEPDNADLFAVLGSLHSAKWPLGQVAGNDAEVWTAASKAWDKAIELDSRHWQARYEKAFSMSMAPEFYGLKPTAIKQFEELRAIQEQGAPEAQHVHTYFRLGTLYKDMGNPEKARQVWEDGLKLFPDSKTITGALEASTKR